MGGGKRLTCPEWHLLVASSRIMAPLKCQCNALIITSSNPTSNNKLNRKSKEIMTPRCTWQTRCWWRLETGMQAEDKGEQNVNRNHTTAYSTAITHPGQHTKKIIIIIIIIIINIVCRNLSFLWNVKFWAEPQNLTVSAECLCLCRILRNSVLAGEKGANMVYFGQVQVAIDN